MRDQMLPSIILFDGVCNFCNYWVQFIIKRDPQATFQFASLQSEVGQELLEKHSIDRSTDSVVLIMEGQAFVCSDAVLKIVAQLDSPIRWLKWAVIFPRFLRDFIYRIVARNRYKWFGKRDECQIPTKEQRSRFL
ncbi:thiol-disulfide oxidoreductase DCC family protein [Halalkalibacterium halodurans]|uniref:BH0852 protein n=1 Tax=Halalkalibacterium halodurans (strain ATCC BAA-125 / DSM 18197 / FERM 7344 / JCM 9153 / C-125) TaxID=272558 RepID=Q9KEK0_HALH5|nr:thiol-disulfide oxidoreductase DCC family protein [Halalkalibacterium halodurans]MED3648667.1 thiol-disulfide oxidoreductase DCC family protein [Halalkalibacterium halodurans]MED4080784.1 thiol-disulfide oxidoreductase DCC family protein [Halalkalibacterium halodurans]MED4086241.1 thiol-disulfide oxidoreductase DCC family protein [Halalkalibacterium halodurans]MED4106923.1 thiol-disulfide oxidoreductase DCC family protein [Halalkalibacterium halodurans]MED4110266.1 thiol-disulfide oxidoredu